jgi:hypothetical protein
MTSATNAMPSTSAESFGVSICAKAATAGL